MTYMRQITRLLNIRVEEYKINFRRNGYCHNVLSKHKKKNADEPTR